MALCSDESMATLLSSLLKSFHAVPASALPAMLDCVLSSSGVSSSMLFDLLLSSFSNLDEEFGNVPGKLLGAEQCRILVAYSRSLSHLLKNLGVNSVSLQSFIWKAFVPLMKKGHSFDRETLNEIQDSFLEIVSTNSSWTIVEAILVPLFIRSVRSSMDLHQNKETSTNKRSNCSAVQDSEHKLFAPCDGKEILDLASSLPLRISCYVLSSLLGAALERYRAQASLLDGPLPLEGSSSEKKILSNLLWELCDITIHMLLQSYEHRSCAVGLLFPTILDAFAFKHSFEVFVDEKTINISRNSYFMRIWECCSLLFSQGPMERRDAYGIISLYLSYLPCVERCEVEVLDRAEEFDITAEIQFWAEIKRGLVSKENLVRKQALQTLRKALMIHEGKKSSSSRPEKKSLHKSSVPFGMTKRDVYAEEEAMSLGVGKIFESVDHCSVEWMKWEAFILLYEMLEEYGTHLVEAAWNHQIALLLDSSCLEDRTLNAAVGGFCWLAILWERGLFHDNPLVRCLIMESFLHIQWERQGNIAGLFPEDFLLGPFMEGLNDPVHHKDFGLKGIYTSRTIVGAAAFLQHYCIFLGERRCITFLSNLASVAKHQSLGRAGLMALAECISSASNSAGICRIESNHVGIYEARYETDTAPDCNEPGCLDNETSNQKTDLVDGLRFLIESSKQHFNACYRLKVCEKLLQAATMVVCAHELPLDMLFLFIAAVPRDFTDSDVPLRSQLQEWLAGCSKQVCEAKCSDDKMKLLRELLDFPDRFMHQSEHGDSLRDYDDEDMIAWGTMSGRWSRVLFLLIKEPPMQALFTFLKENGTKINQHSYVRCIPVKFLIIILSLVDELEVMLSKAGQGLTMLDKSEDGLQEKVDSVMLVKDSFVVEKFAESFLFILEELTSFSASSCSIFWSDIEEDKADLPGAVIGKLGGPSQRRLSSSMTTSVLRAITSIRTVAFLSSWCSRVKENVDLMTPCTFLWEFFWKVVSKPVCEKETTAEINLAAYEAVSSMLKALVPMFSAPMIKFIRKTNASSPPLDEAKPLLDCLVLSFLEPCNELLRCGKLARTRVAVLLNWKWLCLESLLSLPCHALQNGVNQGCDNCFFSGGVVEHIFDNLVESLENAAEDSVLPMLRSIRLIFDMLTAAEPYISSCNVVDMQMMWKLVQSSWILHVSCKKRRVAPIAVLLSSVLHSSFFGDESMHVADNTIGPLKWFCAKILEEGTKSPRTTRLAALHLSGLWLRNPRIIGLYINELKLLTLYGSVAFDEDFESEINERGDARTEVSLLAKSPDPEITEMFINTELYARVSVAVLFQKLGGLVEMAGSEPEDETCYAALEAGQSFLLALLDSVINDKDLAKELYKKYSAIHRRKVRAWQMICILSPFVNNDLTQQVLHILHMAILRNNMPSVRQYMETFAINIYLKFPQMVREHLVPILADHNMKTQALSSYVYIAANVILHASGTVQSQHLENLLPPIVPLLTSHHHTLRGFTQLLVFKVFSRLLPGSDCTGYETFPLEKKCFVDLKLYLAQNPDCVRLRSSMEGFLDAFNPKHAVTPAGIFSNRTETLEFECVPASLMEQVVNFLNDAREELRDAMAKDEVTIKNESLKSASSPNSMDLPVTVTREDLAGDSPYDLPLDFQKKFTLLKHEREDNSSRCLLDHLEIYKPLADLEKEDKLLMQMLQSRYASMEKIRATRQEIVVVASLIDRIPNLAGLARTCEVFKATGLAVADAKVTQDRQFQLISVTAEKWVPIFEVPVNSMKTYLEKKKREGFCLLGLEQTTNSVSLDKYEFPKRTVLVLGREKEGIPVDIIHILDACVEIPQLGVVRSLNVHVSGGIALWEYTRQQRSK